MKKFNCQRFLYKCAGMDAQERGETCEAHTVDYRLFKKSRKKTCSAEFREFF